MKRIVAISLACMGKWYAGDYVLEGKCYRWRLRH